MRSAEDKGRRRPGAPACARLWGAAVRGRGISHLDTARNTRRQEDGEAEPLSGRELSDQEIEALADEAGRGYDLSTWTRLPVGRPSLGTSGPAPRVQVPADPRLATALKDRARSEKRSVSEIARTALAEYEHRTS